MKARLVGLSRFLRRSIPKAIVRLGTRKDFESLNNIDQQNLSRFSEQDIILESEADIQKYLPDVLGQALARTWIDKRFLDAFFDYPVEILERGGVYLPEKIQLEFIKEEKSRPKVTVFEKTQNGRKKILELKLIMVAEQ